MEEAKSISQRGSWVVCIIQAWWITQHSGTSKTLWRDHTVCTVQTWVCHVTIHGRGEWQSPRDITTVFLYVIYRSWTPNNRPYSPAKPRPRRRILFLKCLRCELRRILDHYIICPLWRKQAVKWNHPNLVLNSTWSSQKAIKVWFYVFFCFYSWWRGLLTAHYVRR